MRKAVLAVCLLGAFGAASAQVAPAVDGMLQSIRAESLRGHLSFIASDALEGRGTPSRGQEMAAEYIAAQFRRAGLEPAGDDGYFQTATWQYGPRDMKAFRMSVKVDGKTIEIPSEQAGLRIGDAAKAVDAKDAAMVHITSLDAKFDKGALQGKVALVDLPPDAGRGMQKLVASLHDAQPLLTMVILPRPPEQGAPAPVLVDPDDKDAGRDGNIVLLFKGAAADALKAGKSASLSTHVPAPALAPVKLRNVIGVLRGTDPALKDTYVMVTAHYDHLGIRNGVIFNGANDDGSGTVSVIEIAQAMGAMKERPKRTIVFMTVFGEELGLKGSRYYGRNPVFPIARTVADINLEQMGRTDDSEGPVVNAVAMTGFDYSDMGPIFQRAGAATGIRVFKHPTNSDNYFGASDNQSLADAGVPAHTLSVAYAFPDYHGAGDKWDKIDYANMAKVDRMVALALWEIANDAKAPKWNADNPKAAPYAAAASRAAAKP